MRKFYLVSIPCVTLLTLVGVFAVAHAATDHKSYPAVTCVASNEALNPTHQQGGTLLYSPGVGSVSNGSTTGWLTVVCPMVRDSFATGGGNYPRLLETEIWVDDRAPSAENIRCDVRAQYQLEQDQVECPGSGCTYEVETRNTAFVSGVDFLNFSTIDYVTVAGYNDIYAVCEIPPATSTGAAGRSSIISIRWVEETV
jgi:hypothetical protein